MDASGHQSALIISPLSVADFVQGNGDHEPIFPVAKEILYKTACNISEKNAQFHAVPILHPMNQRFDIRIVIPARDDLIKENVSG